MIGWAISMGILVGYLSTPGSDALMLVASAIFAFAGTFGLKTFK